MKSAEGPDFLDGHRLSSLYRTISLEQFHYFVLQIVDRFVEPLKSLSQNLCARPGGVRERRVTFDEIKQLVDAADSLGGNNAELRKMAAKRRSSSAV